MPDGALRVVINRDESVRRAPSLPPAWHHTKAGRALWPIDPDGGGTWIAAHESGLVLALLNHAPGIKPWAPRTESTAAPSRGRIIPQLIHASTARHALDALETLQERHSLFPFRLLAFHAQQPQAQLATWDGSSLRRDTVASPLCLASSGLGDDLVLPRVELFQKMLEPEGAAPHAQDAFHAHTWPDRTHLSVMMSRPGYRTVSITSVLLTPVRSDPQASAPYAVEMIHTLIPPARPS
jgi:hypothetical protein